MGEWENKEGKPSVAGGEQGGGGGHASERACCYWEILVISHLPLGFHDVTLPHSLPHTSKHSSHHTIRWAGELNSHSVACIIATSSVFRSHRLLLSILSLQLGHSEPHKETFVPSLVEWSLVLEVVKEIQGDRTSKQSNTRALL